MINILILQDLVLKKLLEITKEFKEYRFQQNLPVEFSKDDKVLKETIFADPWLHRNNVEFVDINIKELLDRKHK